MNSRSDFVKHKKRIPIIIGVEGNKNNQTEKVYLQEISRLQGRYTLIFADGNETDALNVVKSIIKKCREYKISKKDRLAFCIIDTDNDITKREIINQASLLAQQNNIKMLLSTPSFEYWILLHYERTIKHFVNQSDVIEFIRKKHNPRYSKKLANFDFSLESINAALENLEACRKNMGQSSNDLFHDPNTSFDILVKLLIK